MNVAEKFEHAGVIVKIIQDTDAEAPENGENDLFIVTTRNPYFELLYEGNVSKGEDASECMDPERKDWRKKYWVFPLYSYIHGGVALSLNNNNYPFDCQWDAGQIGFVFAEKKSWRLSAKAEKAAAIYVETWNQYLSGDVYGIVIETKPDDEDDDDAEGEHLDSCWGFYGMEYAKKEAKEMAEHAATKIAKAEKMVSETFAL